MSLITGATPLGWTLPMASRQMSLDQFRNRSALIYGQQAANGANSVPRSSLHTDDAAARLEGLKAPVAAGPTIMALVTRMMMTTFDDGWIRGGKLSLKMIRPVYAQDFVTAKGTLIEKVEEDGRTRLVFEVWVENAQHVKVTVGSASALLPPDQAAE